MWVAKPWFTNHGSCTETEDITPQWEDRLDACAVGSCVIGISLVIAPRLWPQHHNTALRFLCLTHWACQCTSATSISRPLKSTVLHTPLKSLVAGTS